MQQGITTLEKTEEILQYLFRTTVFYLCYRSEPSNACFCEDEPLCDVIGDGMFSISKCPKIMGAPIVLSWPHFLHANSSFIDAVQGMNPDKEKHQFFFDVQPVRFFLSFCSACKQKNYSLFESAFSCPNH